MNFFFHCAHTAKTQGQTVYENVCQFFFYFNLKKFIFDRIGCVVGFIILLI